jgi:hypothetical protein
MPCVRRRRFSKQGTATDAPGARGLEGGSRLRGGFSALHLKAHLDGVHGLADDDASDSTSRPRDQILDEW